MHILRHHIWSTLFQVKITRIPSQLARQHQISWTNHRWRKHTVLTLLPVHHGYPVSCDTVSRENKRPFFGSVYRETPPCTVGKRTISSQFPSRFKYWKHGVIRYLGLLVLFYKRKGQKSPCHFSRVSCVIMSSSSTVASTHRAPLLTQARPLVTQHRALRYIRRIL